jgi:hypothetical protein
VAGLESGSKSASEIEVMVDVPAFNRGALPFDTDSDPDSDAEGT